jgi:hypothetical protein
MAGMPTGVSSAPISSGTITFDNTDTPGKYFLAYVYYEVYAPGDADNPVDAGTYPTVNTDYTYVYSLSSDATSIVPLERLDVGLATGAAVTAYGSIDDAIADTRAPSDYADFTSFFRFNWTGPAFYIYPTKSSDQVFMTSPSGPGNVVITVVWDGTSEDEVEMAIGPAGEPPLGAICGNVLGTCEGVDPGPMSGVTVDLYLVAGGLIGTVETGLEGEYCFYDLLPGYYTAVVVVPALYEADAEEAVVPVPDGETVSQDFALVCRDVVAEPRTIGFWKHQVGAAISRQGNQHIDTATMCAYLDMIENRFNSNAVNEVIVYASPDPATLPEGADLCIEKLKVAQDILALKNKAPMIWRAQQQLLALMFNVASEKIGLFEVISDDGAVVSQAITFCDHLIDDPNGDHEMAKTIADEINNGRMVPAGWIPLDTEIIFYARRLIEMSNVVPTVFTRSTKITFMLGGEGYVPVDLKVFDVTGRLVKSFENRSYGPGLNSVIWDGRSDNGARVATGVYFYRLSTPVDNAAGKMILRR